MEAGRAHKALFCYFRLSLSVASTVLFALLPSKTAAADLTDACLRALGSRTGEICIVDVRTGRILADARTDGVRTAYAPGSTAKLITAYAALHKGVINPATRFVCRNAIRIGGRTYHCTKPGGHGALRLEDAIASSCNIWFYQASERLTCADLQKAWAAFGLAIPETSLKPVFRAAVGESGFTVTPVQMALLMRNIALQDTGSNNPCSVLCRAMRKVTTSGTASALKGAGVSCAGKTGSPSQPQDSQRRHGWFVGFAPAHNPQIAFAVFCLDGNAYRTAVPVTVKLLKSYAAQKPGN